MTDSERRENARQFANKWKSKGYEKGDTQNFWIEFLGNVIGIASPTDYIEYEYQVIVKGNTKFIDGYISETKILIEQKGSKVDLTKPQNGHDGKTPYEQAFEYNTYLPANEKVDWIILCNFREFHIYNLNDKVPKPETIPLDQLPAMFKSFDFLAKPEIKEINHELEVSIEAGRLVGLMYDALKKQYGDPFDDEAMRSLNALIVRIVFCLYAEDADIFGKSEMFYEYMAQYPAKEWREKLISLFKVLDTPEDKRDRFLNEDLAAFPYVNGGLFQDETIIIPPFTQDIIDVVLNKASKGFNWADISPTIFGAVFESTLNPETRRSGGMHYTSIENIHKVIDPLFMDELNAELEGILSNTVIRTRNRKLEELQTKLSTLTFFDPACGSGNFLTETYLSLRKMENRIIETIRGGQISFGFDEINPIKISIGQFYGVEINDFAVTVAKTALWIAESQMMKQTEGIVHQNLDFLPLKTDAHILQGNALRLDWEDVVNKEELTYIMGNPPFVGARLMSQNQKHDITSVFGDGWKNAGNLDYVSCWYKMASDLMTGTNIRAALVSTNSVSQGENVANLWKPLFEQGVHIDFAHRTFVWNSEAKIKAHVHCVIIGFSKCIRIKNKVIYTAGEKEIVNNINAYLIDADNTFVESRSKSICDVPVIGIGNKPIDGGFYLFDKDKMEEFIKKEPKSKEFFREWYGSKEFINRCPRYCLWLGDCSPTELKSMPECIKLVEAVRDYRLNSTSEGTKKLADKPTRFHVENMPKSNFIVIPEVSSERRRYIPIGFMTPNIMCSNLVKIIPDATIYHFGVLISNVHMAWMRTVAGRLKSDYRYSKDIVYNNFPWPTPTDEQKSNIEKTAQTIIDARLMYPDASLADLYDPVTMPHELRKAHQQNDVAVMKAYGFNVKEMSEEKCVAELMKLYQKLSSKG